MPASRSLVKQFDVTFEPDALTYLVKMLLPHLGFELGVVKQKVSEFGSLLHQVDLCHALGFAFELRGGNADQFSQARSRNR